MLSAASLSSQSFPEERVKANLHNPIPVVPSGHPKECEESHAKVVKGGMAAETLTWVLL